MTFIIRQFLQAQCCRISLKYEYLFSVRPSFTLIRNNSEDHRLHYFQVSVQVEGSFKKTGRRPLIEFTFLYRPRDCNSFNGERSGGDKNMKGIKERKKRVTDGNTKDMIPCWISTVSLLSVPHIIQEQCSISFCILVKKCWFILKLPLLRISRNEIKGAKIIP